MVWQNSWAGFWKKKLIAKEKWTIRWMEFSGCLNQLGVSTKWISNINQFSALHFSWVLSRKFRFMMPIKIFSEFNFQSLVIIPIYLTHWRRWNIKIISQIYGALMFVGSDDLRINIEHHRSLHQLIILIAVTGFLCSFKNTANKMYS